MNSSTKSSAILLNYIYLFLTTENYSFIEYNTKILCIEKHIVNDKIIDVNCAIDYFFDFFFDVFFDVFFDDFFGVFFDDFFKGL